MKTTLLLLISILFSQTAFGFALLSRNSASFQPDIVFVDYDLASCEPEFSEAQLKELIQEAMDSTWNTIVYSRLRLKAGENASTANNDRILMECNRTWANEEINGLGAPGDILGTRILNGSFSVNTNPSSDSATQKRQRAWQIRLIAHEAGHAFGLGHSNMEGNIMKTGGGGNATGVGEDDIAAMTYLYPALDDDFSCTALASGQKIPRDHTRGLFIFLFWISVYFVIAKSVKRFA